MERHRQPAAHRLPDEGEPADDRAGDARPLGGDGPLREDSRAPRRARRSSCCTTARRTPTATSTSGTALNKILKDLVVKSRSMAGFDAPYVVGYDCHGLPIELKVDRELGPKKREMSVADFCRACRAYAERFVGTMTEQFQRLGILGTWDAPVPDDGLQVPGGDRARVRPVRRAGARLQGQEAGALVHPLPHRAGRSRGRVRGSHLAVDLRRVPARAGRAPASSARACRRWPAATSRCSSGRRRRGRFRRTWRSRFIRSSTTRAYDVDGRAVIVAEALAPKVAAGRRPAVRRADRADEGRGARAASASSIRSTRATRSACSATTSRSTPAPARSTRRPGHGADDFNTGMKYGLEIYAPIGPAGISSTRSSCSAASACSTRTRTSKQALQGARPPVAPRGVLAPVSALLALPQPGDLPGDVAVVHPAWTASRRSRRGRRATHAARGGARRDRPPGDVDPGVGPRPHLQHGREPARLVHLAPARLGRADPGGRLHDVRRGDR